MRRSMVFGSAQTGRSMNRFGSERDHTMRVKGQGPGIYPQFNCFGCSKLRVTTGSKGVGIFKRCASCVAAAAAKRAA